MYYMQQNLAINIFATYQNNNKTPKQVIAASKCICGLYDSKLHYMHKI